MSNEYSWRKMNLIRRRRVREREIADIKLKYFNSKILIPEDNISELMDIAWQEDRYSEGNPIGYVLVNNSSNPQKREFIFAYSEMGVKLAQSKGFRQLPAFPDLSRVYISQRKLFPAFQTKIPQKARIDLVLPVSDLSSKECLSKIDTTDILSGVLTDDVLLIPSAYYNRPKRDKHVASLKRVNGQKRGTINKGGTIIISHDSSKAYFYALSSHEDKRLEWKKDKTNNVNQKERSYFED